MKTLAQVLKDRETFVCPNKIQIMVRKYIQCKDKCYFPQNNRSYTFKKNRYNVGFVNNQLTKFGKTTSRVSVSVYNYEQQRWVKDYF